MRRLAGSILLALVAACSPGQERVVVAAGTTIVDSGLLDVVAARYEDEHSDVRLSVVGDATARVLELGRRGAADLLLTHAPRAEAEFVADGLAVAYEPVFTSRFVLVGPPDRVGDLAGLPITRALGEIAAREWTFISRADGSGTHAAELRLWREAGFDPSPEPWYLETGQSMGLTLQVADQRGAFTLAEVGAFRAAAETLALVPADVVEHHPGALSNPYHATVVTGGAEQPALRFLRWLRSTDGRTAVIAMNLELFGEVLYEPAG